MGKVFEIDTINNENAQNAFLNGLLTTINYKFKIPHPSQNIQKLNKIYMSALFNGIFTKDSCLHLKISFSLVEFQILKEILARFTNPSQITDFSRWQLDHIY